MELTIYTENIRLTDDLEAYVQDKLSKLERYMPNIESVHVELEIKNSSRGPDTAVAQITVRHDRGAILRTEEKLDKQDYNTIKMALNGAQDKMLRRIKRFKGKGRSKRLRERYTMSPEEFKVAEPLPVESETVAETETVLEESAESQIVRRKVVGVIAMNEEEAIEQMELLGHNFFVFYNPEKQAMNIIYRRGTEGYGILEPELA
ncbi:MAG: ribosome-associated translation inhibitor RaiA [Chloroflexota bacterium]